MSESKATISQIKSIYGRLVYTHKTYEKLYESTISLSNRLKIIQIILSALTTTGVVAIIFTTFRCVEIITTIISTLALALTLYLKENDLAFKAKEYGNTANALVSIRNECESLIVDYNDQKLSVAVLASRRDDILKKQDSILGNSLKTNGQGYRMACKALKNNQEMTFESDEEIELFLPEYIRGRN